MGLLLPLSYATAGYLNLCAETVLLGRLWHLGLIRSYRFFSAFLGAEVLRAIAVPLFFGSTATDAYGWFYVGTAPVIVILQVLVVLELYTLVLRHHPGIRTLGRWVVAGGLLIGVAVTALTLAPDFSNAGQQYRLLLYTSVLERTVASVLLLLLVAIASFLVWFPVPLSRNTVVHSLLFGVYFAGAAALLMVRNAIGPEIIRTLSTVNLVLAACCFVAWSLLLSRDGERRVVVVGHRWRPDAGRRLVQQLQAINDGLLRAGRK